MRDLPIKETTQVTKVAQLEGEELVIKKLVLLLVMLVSVVHVCSIQLALARIDHLVDLALDVTQLFLLCSELVGLA